MWSALLRVCVGRKLSSDWGDERNLAFIAATILNFGLAKFKIVAAMNAKLHISPQSEENFLPTQTLGTI